MKYQIYFRYLSARLHILCFFVNTSNEGQGKSGYFSLPVWEKSGNSQEILIHVLGMNPVWAYLAVLFGASLSSFKLSLSLSHIYIYI